MNAENHQLLSSRPDHPIHNFWTFLQESSVPLNNTIGHLRPDAIFWGCAEMNSVRESWDAVKNVDEDFERGNWKWCKLSEPKHVGTLWHRTAGVRGKWLLKNPFGSDCHEAIQLIRSTPSAHTRRVFGFGWIEAVFNVVLSCKKTFVSICRRSLLGCPRWVTSSAIDPELSEMGSTQSNTDRSTPRIQWPYRADTWGAKAIESPFNSIRWMLRFFIRANNPFSISRLIQHFIF